MRSKVWALSFIAGATFVVGPGCGAEDTDSGTSLTAKPGDAVDLDGDGVIDGFAVDEDGDGIADGVDTNNDGKVDAPLPGAGGDNAGNGGANGVANGTTPANNGGTSAGNPENCEELVARAMPTTPDMLIVLDRSRSMKDGNINRWDPSGSAVKAITSNLDDQIRFGLMLFPKPCAPTDVLCALQACTPGELEVPVDLGTSGAIASELDGTQPLGGTPTGATLQAAQAILDARVAGPDGAAAPKYILLVTDGQPTCPSAKGSGTATAAQLTADRQLTVSAIDALLKSGAKTYVIGYDAKSDAKLASALTEFAQRGGTGDYRAVEDEASLLTEFQKIAGEVVSCSYNLDTAPTDPSYVLVELDGKQLNLNQPDGWSISGTAVTVQGQACATLQDGKDHTLSVKVKCDVVPII